MCLLFAVFNILISLNFQSGDQRMSKTMCTQEQAKTKSSIPNLCAWLILADLNFTGKNFKLFYPGTRQRWFGRVHRIYLQDRAEVGTAVRGLRERPERRLTKVVF